jgi:hypothetical protein
MFRRVALLFGLAVIVLGCSGERLYDPPTVDAGRYIAGMNETIDQNDWWSADLAESMGVNPVEIYFVLPMSSAWTVDILSLKTLAVVRSYAGYSGAGVTSIVWDVRDNEGHRVPPGMYRYLVTAAGFSSYHDVQVLYYVIM